MIQTPSGEKTLQHKPFGDCNAPFCVENDTMKGALFAKNVEKCCKKLFKTDKKLHKNGESICYIFHKLFGERDFWIDSSGVSTYNVHVIFVCFFKRAKGMQHHKTGGNSQTAKTREKREAIKKGGKTP